MMTALEKRHGEINNLLTIVASTRHCIARGYKVQECEAQHFAAIEKLLDLGVTAVQITKAIG